MAKHKGPALAGPKAGQHILNDEEDRSSIINNPLLDVQSL